MNLKEFYLVSVFRIKREAPLPGTVIASTQGHECGVASVPPTIFSAGCSVTGAMAGFPHARSGTRDWTIFFLNGQSPRAKKTVSCQQSHSRLSVCCSCTCGGISPFPEEPATCNPGWCCTGDYTDDTNLALAILQARAWNFFHH